MAPQVQGAWAGREWGSALRKEGTAGVWAGHTEQGAPLLASVFFLIKFYWHIADLQSVLVSGFQRTSALFQLLFPYRSFQSLRRAPCAVQQVLIGCLLYI